MSAPAPLRVLLVDDSEAARMIGRICLDEAPVAVEVVEAEGGEEALSYLRGCEAVALPDVVLLDLRMPGVSGTDVLTRMKADETLKAIAVVISSAHLSYEVIDQCRALGADGIIGKDLAQISAFAEGLGRFRDQD